MIDLYNINPLLYKVFTYIYYVTCKVENRYIKGNSIVIYNMNYKKYDGIHDYYMIQFIFDIKICTFVKNNYIKYLLYLGDTKLSELTLINNTPIDNMHKENLSCNKIIQTIFFMDDLFTVNRIIIYNCGIIVHSSFFGSHIYNYKGERRVIEYIDNFENIQNITYK